MACVYAQMREKARLAHTEKESELDEQVRLRNRAERRGQGDVHEGAACTRSLRAPGPFPEYGAYNGIWGL
jgi:hypothetical protein